MTNLTFSGANLEDLSHVLQSGVDHGGNTVEPFVDREGGWPLRCCLNDSAAGEELALIAWSPFSWKGVYAETGPVFVHAVACSGLADTATLPASIDTRAMVLRPYTHDRRIAYHHVQHVAAGASLSELTAGLLDLDDVDFVHGRNVTGGCFSFEARRAIP